MKIKEKENKKERKLHSLFTSRLKETNLYENDGFQEDLAKALSSAPILIKSMYICMYVDYAKKS